MYLVFVENSAYYYLSLVDCTTKPYLTECDVGELEAACSDKTTESNERRVDNTD